MKNDCDIIHIITIRFGKNETLFILFYSETKAIISDETASAALAIVYTSTLELVSFNLHKSRLHVYCNTRNRQFKFNIILGNTYTITLEIISLNLT